MKEVKINFSTGKGDEFKFLISLYRGGVLSNWYEVSDTKNIPSIVSDFYFKPQECDRCFGVPCKHDGTQKCSLTTPPTK